MQGWVKPCEGRRRWTEEREEKTIVKLTMRSLVKRDWWGPVESKDRNK